MDGMITGIALGASLAYILELRMTLMALRGRGMGTKRAIDGTAKDGVDALIVTIDGESVSIQSDGVYRGSTLVGKAFNEAGATRVILNDGRVFEIAADGKVAQIGVVESGKIVPMIVGNPQAYRARAAVRSQR